MGNMPVIKDLVVDMSSFWNHLEAVEPYVSTGARQSRKEFCKHLKSDRSLIRLVLLCGLAILSAREQPRFCWSPRTC